MELIEGELEGHEEVVCAGLLLDLFAELDVVPHVGDKLLALALHAEPVVLLVLPLERVEV